MNAMGALEVRRGRGTYGNSCRVFGRTCKTWASWNVVRGRARHKIGMPSLCTHPTCIWCSILSQEVEILSSDSEVDSKNKGGGVEDSGEENGESDFQGSSNGPRRKRSKKEQRSRDRDDGASSTKPASRSVGKHNKLPATGTQTRHPAYTDLGRSERSPNSSDTGGYPSRAQEMEPLNGGTNKVGAESNLSVFGGPATVDEDAPSEVVVNTSIFDLEENAKRRTNFQAGLKASLRGNEDPSIAAAEGGDNHGISGAGAGLSDGVPGMGSASTGGSSTTSASRGKGKGAAAGRVKLTPMEQQVVDLKAKHPGVLLLVECGYRYRFFGEDALAAAKVSNSWYEHAP